MLFQKPYLLLVYQEILGYIAFQKENTYVEWSILPLLWLDAWITSVVECFSKWETRSWHRLKRYADPFGKNMKMEVNLIVGQIQGFIEWWEPKELIVPSESEDENSRTEGLLVMNEMPQCSWTSQKGNGHSIQFAMNSFPSSLVENWEISMSVLLQSFAENTAKLQNLNGKWILILRWKNKWKKYHESDFVGCVMVRLE